MKSLHNEIMNIQVPDGIEDQAAGDRIIYKTGHRDARHAAAELADKYQGNYDRLVEALRDCEEVLSYVARKSGLTHSNAEGVAIEVRALLAQLDTKGEE